MMHKLCSWEDNGYHDSYFYEAVWNDETCQVEGVQTGSTAYAGGIGGYPAIKDENMLMQAITWLSEHIYKRIREAEYRDVLEPNEAPHGAEMQLLRDVKYKGTVIPKGTWGDVFWSQAYGQFFRKGYNRPGRGNIRVGLRLPDGERVFVALSACRLKREPMTDAELHQRAVELAKHCGFGTACGMKAWESDNPARELYTRMTQQAAQAA